MAQRNNGGPAFPRPASEDTRNGTLQEGNNVEPAADGMSLRDYFAAHAPAPNAQWLADSFGDGKARAEAIAAWRWYYADTMLVERKR